MMENTTEDAVFGEAEKDALLALLKQLKALGLKSNMIAEATGINYKSFINKAKSLEVDAQGGDSASRNRFTKADYKAIMAWWLDYRQKAFSI